MGGEEVVEGTVEFACFGDEHVVASDAYAAADLFAVGADDE